MGAPAARKTDLSSGHSCFPPAPIMNGSSNVKINGKEAARQGDKVKEHACPLTSSHGSVIINPGCSTTVFINGMPAARVGSQCSCPQTIITGSGNVMIGG